MLLKLREYPAIIDTFFRSRKIRQLNEQDLQTLLQSDDNYYNCKRSNNQSYQNFIRILIVALLGAFIAKTPWNALNLPILAYIGVGSLIIAVILNIFEFRISQDALDQYRNATHKTFDKRDTSYIDEVPKAFKKLDILSDCVIFFLILSIVICPISYVVENTLGPKEVKQMSKKPRSTEQPSRKVVQPGENRWNKPSSPITPTPADPPAEPTPAPTEPATEPAPAPAEPAPDPKPSTEK